MTQPTTPMEKVMETRPAVFVGDDYSVADILEKIAEELAGKGYRIIRSGTPMQGRSASYDPAAWPHLFGDTDIMLISSRTDCPRKLLEAAPRLRGVVFPTIGTDAVNLQHAEEMGLIIGHGPVPENPIGMAEATVMLIAALFLDLRGKELLTRENLPRPKPTELPARLVNGKTIGLVGFGRIARSVVERLMGWGVTILAYDPYVTQSDVPDTVQFCDLETLLRASDLVSIHVSLTGETRRMIGAEQIALMNPGSYLINNSRGGAIDEAAVTQALESGHLAGAALDVFENEPLPADSPLREAPNVILTSHIIGHSREANIASIPAAVENIERIVRGEPPLYTRNPEVLDKWKERLRDLPKLA